MTNLMILQFHHCRQYNSDRSSSLQVVKSDDGNTAKSPIARFTNELTVKLNQNSQIHNYELRII